jgi:DNA repair exonuclease SbcCD ATPase subunit
MSLEQQALRARHRGRILDERQGEARAILTRGQELQAEVATLTEDVTELDRVTALLNSMGEDRQQKAQQTIEELVTRGLQTIFDETLSFHIVQRTSGRSVQVDFVVRTTLHGRAIDTPVMDARGGGLAATIGFLLRLVVLLLTRGQRQDTLMVLDETFAHVSAEYLPAVSAFLREVVDKTGVQIVLVTHQEELVEGADKVYRFSMSDGQTKVEAVV